MAPDRQISMLKKLKPEMLCSFIRRIEPMKTDVAVLRWIAARQELDLGTALTLFFAFDPGRLNLLPRNAYPKDLQDRCSVIDVLCQRINCGFYIPIAARKIEDQAQVRDWLCRQEQDVEIGRRGRWVLNDKIVAPLIAERRERVTGGRVGPRPGFIQGIFSPLFVSNRA
ncbi:hypothetical protein [Pseudooceanicola batsensis]|nr:hypothetical protein [Pseudooceanicola batsensis]